MLDDLQDLDAAPGWVRLFGLTTPPCVSGTPRQTRSARGEQCQRGGLGCACYNDVVEEQKPGIVTEAEGERGRRATSSTAQRDLGVTRSRNIGLVEQRDTIEFRIELVRGAAIAGKPKANTIATGRCHQILRYKAERADGAKEGRKVPGMKIAVDAGGAGIPGQSPGRKAASLKANWLPGFRSRCRKGLGRRLPELSSTANQAPLHRGLQGPYPSML